MPLPLNGIHTFELYLIFIGKNPPAASPVTNIEMSFALPSIDEHEFGPFHFRVRVS